MKRLSTIIITIIEKELGKLKHKDPYIAKNKIERMYLILDVHSREFTWLAFYMFNAFR